MQILHRLKRLLAHAINPKGLTEQAESLMGFIKIDTPHMHEVGVFEAESGTARQQQKTEKCPALQSHRQIDTE